LICEESDLQHIVQRSSQMLCKPLHITFTIWRQLEKFERHLI